MFATASCRTADGAGHISAGFSSYWFKLFCKHDNLRVWFIPQKTSFLCFSVWHLSWNCHYKGNKTFFLVHLPEHLNVVWTGTNSFTSGNICIITWIKPTMHVLTWLNIVWEGLVIVALGNTHSFHNLKAWTDMHLRNFKLVLQNFAPRIKIIARDI